MSTTTTAVTTTTKRKLIVSFISRANEPKLQDWLVKNYGGYGHNSLRNGAFRRQVAARASQELGFKVTERNLQSRYYKVRAVKAQSTASATAASAPVTQPAQTPSAHVPMSKPVDDVTALKRVANEQHARITSLENQVRRLFSIARKYVPSEDISAPQADLNRPFAGV